MLATDKVNGGYENFLSQLFVTSISYWRVFYSSAHSLSLFHQTSLVQKENIGNRIFYLIIA